MGGGENRVVDVSVSSVVVVVVVVVVSVFFVVDVVVDLSVFSVVIVVVVSFFSAVVVDVSVFCVADVVPVVVSNVVTPAETFSDVDDGNAESPSMTRSTADGLPGLSSISLSSSCSSPKLYLTLTLSLAPLEFLPVSGKLI